jgi:hypothetical protein
VNTKFVNVYRGIRGELPEAFWLKDDFGDVTATDFAFMSTSVDQEVCKHYMDTKQQNVLWEIRCSSETAEGFHSGADVSMLSQYPQEVEMLFPPLTMLKVVVVEKVAVAAGKEEAADGFAEVEEVFVKKTEGEVAENVEETVVEGAAAEAEKKHKLPFDSLHSVAKTVVAAAKSERLREVLGGRRGSQRRVINRGQQEQFEKRDGGVATYTRVVVTPVFV